MLTSILISLEKRMSLETFKLREDGEQRKSKIRTAQARTRASKKRTGRAKQPEALSLAGVERTGTSLGSERSGAQVTAGLRRPQETVERSFMTTALAITGGICRADGYGRDTGRGMRDRALGCECS